MQNGSKSVMIGTACYPSMLVQNFSYSSKEKQTANKPTKKNEQERTSIGLSIKTQKVGQWLSFLKILNCARG